MKPLLAATLEDTSKLQFPVFASPKLDGIRVLIKDGVVLSRNLKPIRNKHVQKLLGLPEYDGLDGEIIVGEATDPMVFRNTSSGVMSEDGEPEFVFYVFDRWDQTDLSFEKRYDGIKNSPMPPFMNYLPQKVINSHDELEEFEGKVLGMGFEGAMIRSLDGKYKYGRSTLKEGILLKLKRFNQDEAVVVGFEERMHNANEAKKDALGRTERSTHKENLIGRGDLGAVRVLFQKPGMDPDMTGSAVEFTIGSGFTDAERAEIWNNKDKYLGKIVTFKHFTIGNYDAPRFPTFVGFRDPNDMSE